MVCYYKYSHIIVSRRAVSDRSSFDLVDTKCKIFTYWREFAGTRILKDLSAQRSRDIT